MWRGVVIVPPRLEILGWEAELEGGTGVHIKEVGDGANIGRLLVIFMGKWERDFFKHGFFFNFHGTGFF